MAEEAKIITDDTLLTQEELNEFKQLHNKILIAQFNKIVLMIIINV